MAKKEFDPEMIDRKCAHGGNSVEYYVYHDERKGIHIPKDPGKEFKTKIRTGVCFSDLLYHIRDGDPKPNRVYYHMKESKSLSGKLTDKERAAWIELSKKYKLLPHYVEDDVWKTGIMVLDITGMSPSLLYVHVSSLRYMREEPGFVKAMVYLVKKLKMNFYAAFVFSSKNCMTAPGHHIINLYRNYYDKQKDIEKTVISLKMIRNLRFFLRDPSKHDKRGLDKKIDRYEGFCCSPTVDKIKSTEGLGDINIEGKNLFDINVIRAIKATSKEDLDKHLKEYKKGKK